jgi:hypothetical protein
VFGTTAVEAASALEMKELQVDTVVGEVPVEARPKSKVPKGVAQPKAQVKRLPERRCKRIADRGGRLPERRSKRIADRGGR